MALSATADSLKLFQTQRRPSGKPISRPVTYVYLSRLRRLPCTQGRQLLAKLKMTPLVRSRIDCIERELQLRVAGGRSAGTRCDIHLCLGAHTHQRKRQTGQRTTEKRKAHG